jgi:hypothetical protein
MIRAMPSAHKLPVVCVVVHGGDKELYETLEAVRLHYLIIVIAGTGGAADQIAAAYRMKEGVRQHFPIIL